MSQKLTFKNILQHWEKIRLHRKWVRHYCFLAGIPWRGIIHDLSKYSPTEFFESARYYVGTSSPIDAAKKDKGYSAAWLHHRGRNRHHWAYWADNFSEGMAVLPMPKKDFVEMVCDFLAAGHSYSINNHFSYSREREWWMRERERGCAAMNEKNKIMLDIIFSDLEKCVHPSLINIEETFIDWMPSPEQLIKSGYIQAVWEANK